MHATGTPLLSQRPNLESRTSEEFACCKAKRSTIHRYLVRPSQDPIDGMELHGAWVWRPGTASAPSSPQKRKAPGTPGTPALPTLRQHGGNARWIWLRQGSAAVARPTESAFRAPRICGQRIWAPALGGRSHSLKLNQTSDYRLKGLDKSFLSTWGALTFISSNTVGTRKPCFLALVMRS